MKSTPAIAAAALIVLAGCSGFVGGEPERREPIEMAADPPDPSEDVVGWEGGYWYNETIDVDQSDGLSRSERRALVARTAARVERIRGLEFREPVPTATVSRSAFEGSGSDDVSPARRRFVNAKFEALFMIEEETDAVAVRRSGESAVVGFYSPTRDRIVLIEEGDRSRIRETTLAHELTHALQDQHYDLTQYQGETREEQNAVDGLIEGDANLVQFRYEQRCEGVWNGTCVSPPRRETEQGAGGLENVGPYLLRYQPYSDGPAFVRQTVERGGWDAVDKLYADPPASTEQTIHPELYGEDPPATVTVPDRSSADWTRLEVPGRPDYAQVGEAGLASMLVRPAVATQGRAEVVSARSFFTGNASFDPYAYGNRYSAGWDGDRLAIYTNPETPPDETGYVYRTVWDSPAQAEEFAAGYRELLRIEGARQVADRPNVWRIPEGTGFGDAYRVRVDGDAVVVVNAPSVEGLSAVHEPPTG